jgi:hypothetical protein
VEGRGEASGGRVSGGRGRWRARGAERSGAGAAGARETAVLVCFNLKYLNVTA